MRLQHRREQANGRVLPLEPVTTAPNAVQPGHGTALADGNSPSGHACEVAPSPIDSPSSSACGARHARARLRSGQRAGFASRFRERPCNWRSASASSKCATCGVAAFFVVDRRVAGAQTERGIQRPLVRFGCGIEPVERRFERQRRTGRVFSTPRIAIGPTRGRARARCFAPAPQRRVVEGPGAVSSRAGAVEDRVGAGRGANPRTVRSRRHRPCEQAQSLSSRSKRRPRSSRTTPSIAATSCSSRVVSSAGTSTAAAAAACRHRA